MVVSLLIPSSYASKRNILEINLDNYQSSSDKYNYKVWNIDNIRLPLYGEFTLRFNSNIYYEDIESIAIMKDGHQTPVKMILNNASADITILEALDPDKEYDIIVYGDTKYKYSIKIKSRQYGDIENNNTPLQANKLILGDKIKGYVGPDNPDYFTFEIDKPTEVEFNLIRGDKKKITLEPFVLDELGNEYIEIDKDVKYTDNNVLFKNYFLPGNYYIKISDASNDSGEYLLETKYKLFSTYYEREDNDTFEQSEQISDNTEINNNLNYYKTSGDMDKKDIYNFYISEESRVEIKYDSNKKGNYLTLYKYDDPFKYEVEEEYKNKADDFSDKMTLDEGHYYIEILNKAYKGVSYTLELDID
jgi:hypothetical protein